MTLKWFSSYASVDEEFDNVSLLLHGDGTNGSTTIVDSSSSPKAVTAVGNAQISTAQSKFGGSSLVFDGNDKLEAGTSADFDLSSGDFTVECWFYVPSTITDTQSIVSKWGGSINNGWRIDITSTAVSWYTEVSSKLSSSYAIQQWNHLAIAKSGSTSSMYLNGVLVSGPTNDSFSASDPAKPLCVGALDHNSFFYGFNGYIDDFRITKGVARYTSNFTPPTAPFPDLSPSGRITIEDNSLDVDARQYIINVEEQDGQSLESGVRTAINDFVVGCKSDGIWDAIKASCILAGARTLDGALVPLVGGAPTNYNFVSGDYNRETGLVGDGSTKYLDSNRNNDTDPQNSKHLSTFVTYAGTGTSPYLADSGSTGSSVLILRGFTGNHGFKNNANTIAGANNKTTGFVGSSRSNAGSFNFRDPSSGTSTASISSETPHNGNLCVHRFGNSGGFGNSRVAFYSIGESLDLALLDTRVSNLITAIGGAI